MYQEKVDAPYEERDEERIESDNDESDYQTMGRKRKQEEWEGEGSSPRRKTTFSHEQLLFAIDEVCGQCLRCCV